VSLAVAGCRWLSLAVAGCRWLSLAVAGCCWLSLAVADANVNDPLQLQKMIAMWLFRAVDSFAVNTNMWLFLLGKT
jgi:hypothetical protein